MKVIPMRDSKASGSPIVAYTGEYWRTPDGEALAAELAAAGYIELQHSEEVPF
jgi:hypothetical protein